MSERAVFPCYVYYRDGRELLVYSQEHADTRAPGWSPDPNGPWDDGLEGRVPWRPHGGPFHPHPITDLAALHELGHSAYAMRHVVLHGTARFAGEAFLLTYAPETRWGEIVLRFTPDEATLLDDGAIKLFGVSEEVGVDPIKNVPPHYWGAISPDSPTFLDLRTGRHFITGDARRNYMRARTTGDIAGLASPEQVRNLVRESSPSHR